MKPDVFRKAIQRISAKKTFLVWFIQVITMPALAQDGFSLRSNESFEISKSSAIFQTTTIDQAQRTTTGAFSTRQVNKSVRVKPAHPTAKHTSPGFSFKVSRPNLLVPEIQKVLKFKPLIGFSIRYSF